MLVEEVYGSLHGSGEAWAGEVVASGGVLVELVGDVVCF